MKFAINKILFDDWNIKLYNNDKCISIKESENYIDEDIKIMPLCVSDYIKYNNDEKNIFKNNLENIEILDNKSKFGKYMLNKFPDNIPTIFYYNFDTDATGTFADTYNSNIINIKEKLIQKPNKNYGSIGIKIIDNFEDNIKNHIIQQYFIHKEYFVGHYLVLNGIIICSVYFYSNFSNNILDQHPIKRGLIDNYEILTTLQTDDIIFSHIFNDLNYSGFACADFTIHNNNIIIFEINPRPGGSLIHNENYLNIFLDKLYTLISSIT